ncbi:hypothetical protein AB6A40_007679 [Gnathostoma spinigerum]|uniref:Uncharacterized protein n=1 Tax=Gnathostoma spinigerum TaxID=75299 RepID=A0ABD6EXI4_9BILA
MSLLIRLHLVVKIASFLGMEEAVTCDFLSLCRGHPMIHDTLLDCDKIMQDWIHETAKEMKADLLPWISIMKDEFKSLVSKQNEKLRIPKTPKRYKERWQDEPVLKCDRNPSNRQMLSFGNDEIEIATEIASSAAGNPATPHTTKVNSVTSKQKQSGKQMSSVRNAATAKADTTGASTSSTTRGCKNFTPASNKKIRKSILLKKIEEKVDIVQFNKEQILREKQERARRDREEKARRVQMNNRKKQEEMEKKVQQLKEREEKLNEVRNQQKTPTVIGPKSPFRVASNKRRGVLTPSRSAIRQGRQSASRRTPKKLKMDGQASDVSR